MLGFVHGSWGLRSGYGAYMVTTIDRAISWPHLMDLKEIPVVRQLGVVVPVCNLSIREGEAVGS